MLFSRCEALLWGLCLLVDACAAARSLHGRFLHITDFHPDPFYKTYSSTAEKAACHRKRGPAGFYGAETSGCDSPLSLVNETFRWINDNLKDTIDFIVWTGDSARHDNDEKIPRTEGQVFSQNELVVDHFASVFGRQNGGGHHNGTIPIVPTFGNNDIMPHNIFLAGPNKWTMKFLDIWRDFIPEAQRHQFQEGGWFYVEVIPQKLAVISLNTMYFFDSNKAVDGCANKHEPGYEHMEWLRIQLQLMRERGMKALLIGHVPPARVDSKLSWDETCWQKYTLWQRQYRDIIIGSMYGHMNIDHFILQDFDQIRKGTKKGKMSSSVQTVRTSFLDDGQMTVASASDYLQDLGDIWSRFPVPPSMSKDYFAGPVKSEETSAWKWMASLFGRSQRTMLDGASSHKKYFEKIGGPYAERYSLSLVSPSVVPNYFPTLRVFSYNISGLEDASVWTSPFANASSSAELGNVMAEAEQSDDGQSTLKKDKKKKHKKGKGHKKHKKYKFKVPEPPSKSAPPGPAYSPQALTLLGYTQYYANLTHINNDFVILSSRDLPETADVNATNITASNVSEESETTPSTAKWRKGKYGKHVGKKPHPEPHPKPFKFEVEYDTQHDKRFKLRDLTIRSYVELAARIGHDKRSNGLSGPEVAVDEELRGSTTLAGEQSKKQDVRASGKKHKPAVDGPWYTFLQRAFVAALDPWDAMVSSGIGAGDDDRILSDDAPLAEEQEEGEEDEDEVLEL